MMTKVKIISSLCVFVTLQNTTSNRHLWANSLIRLQLHITACVITQSLISVSFHIKKEVLLIAVRFTRICWQSASSSRGHKNLSNGFFSVMWLCAWSKIKKQKQDSPPPTPTPSTPPHNLLFLARPKSVATSSQTERFPLLSKCSHLCSLLQV